MGLRKKSRLAEVEMPTACPQARQVFETSGAHPWQLKHIDATRDTGQETMEKLQSDDPRPDPTRSEWLS